MSSGICTTVTECNYAEDTATRARKWGKKGREGEEEELLFCSAERSDGDSSVLFKLMKGSADQRRTMAERRGRFKRSRKRPPHGIRRQPPDHSKAETTNQPIKAGT